MGWERARGGWAWAKAADRDRGRGRGRDQDQDQDQGQGQDQDQDQDENTECRTRTRTRTRTLCVFPYNLFLNGQMPKFCVRSWAPQIYQHSLCTQRFFAQAPPLQEKQTVYISCAGRFEGPSS